MKMLSSRLERVVLISQMHFVMSEKKKKTTTSPHHLMKKHSEVLQLIFSVAKSLMTLPILHNPDLLQLLCVKEQFKHHPQQIIKYIPALVKLACNGWSRQG